MKCDYLLFYDGTKVPVYFYLRYFGEVHFLRKVDYSAVTLSVTGRSCGQIKGYNELLP